MALLNVSVTNPDKVLAEVLDNIDGESTVRGATRAPGDPSDGVLETLLAAEVTEPIDLDLIAHAANGELQLGNWAITAEEPFAEVLAEHLPPGLLGRVRLLGCYTADTSAGRAAMQHLKTVLGVPVWGATTELVASQFGSYGFHGAGLIEAANLPTAAPSSVGAKAESAFARMTSIPAIPNLVDQLLVERPMQAGAMAARYPAHWPLKKAAAGFHPPLGALLGGLVPSHLRIAPGLLLFPDAELLYPVPQRPGKFHRASLFFGGRIVRVYPLLHPRGVLFRHSGLIIA